MDSIKNGILEITDKGYGFLRSPDSNFEAGTEDIYKIYAESFIGEDHLEKILQEAQEIVNQAIS